MASFQPVSRECLKKQQHAIDLENQGIGDPNINPRMMADFNRVREGQPTMRPRPENDPNDPRAPFVCASVEAEKAHTDQGVSQDTANPPPKIATPAAP